MSYSPRTASVTRGTNETTIRVNLNLDATPGSGIQQEIDVKTGVGFLDHVRSFSWSPFARFGFDRGACRCFMPSQSTVDGP